MLNKIELMGRLVADPELRYTTSQKPVATFALAVDRDYSNSGGDRQTDFVNCVAWNQGAEFITKQFYKGKLMALVGRLQSRKWQDDNGKTHTDWEVNVENVYFCGDGKQERV